MSKSKKEINPLSVERINELISESGMTQKEFAEKVVHCAQQHMNRMARGKAPITAETAAQITKYFSDIRSEWILGKDDSKTISDYLLANVDPASKAISFEMLKSKNLAAYAFDNYLECYGYSSEYFQYTMPLEDEHKLAVYIDSMKEYKAGLIKAKSEEPVFEFESHDINEKYWIIKNEKNNTFFNVSVELYEDTIQEIADFAEFKIKKLIEGSKADG